MVATTHRYLKLGLIGHPVSHSISPLLHGAAMSFAGIEGEYNLIDVSPGELEKEVSRLVAEGYAGFNVTVPWKQDVFRLVDELTDEAKKVGAVNTVSIADGGKLIGHNTDLQGFMFAVWKLLGQVNAERHAVIIGAGGAARAAVWGLGEIGCRDLKIVARNQAQVRELEKVVGAMGSAATLARESKCNLVINCTPIGLKDDDLIPEWVENILSAPSASNERFFYDMVYAGRNRSTTPLVTLARSHGWQAADGLDMLIYQAAQAFEFWSGVAIPSEVMRKALS